MLFVFGLMDLDLLRKNTRSDRANQCTVNLLSRMGSGNLLGHEYSEKI